MMWHDSAAELRTQSQPVISPADLEAIELDTQRCDALGTLDDFAHKTAADRGVMVEALEVGTVVTAWTKHSCYRLVIVDPANRLARVTGGSLFKEPTEVRIEGATIGGSMIKSGWIGAGLRMELSIGLRRITTSRVKFLSFDDAVLATSVA